MQCSIRRRRPFVTASRARRRMEPGGAWGARIADIQATSISVLGAPARATRAAIEKSMPEWLGSPSPAVLPLQRACSFGPHWRGAARPAARAGDSPHLEAGLPLDEGGV